MIPFSYSNNSLVCNGVSLAAIADRYGTPVYVYDADYIRARCRDIRSSLGGASHLACYAVKANANREILRLIAAEDFGADVGSRGELYLAMQSGFKPSTITYSGVGKRDDEIEDGILKGVKAFNVESREEIDVIEGIADRLGRRAGILLRVNLDLDAGTHAYISTSKKQNKFGVPWRDAVGLLRYASTLSHIDVRGVHSHIGSQIISIPVFEHAAKMLVEVVQEVRAAGIPVHDLDFGGGFGIQYHGVLVHPGLPAEHAEVRGSTVPAVLRAVLPILRSSGCAIAVQPGRSIVAQAGVLLVRVLYRKVTQEKVFIITDGGMNDLLRPSLYHAHHQIVPVMLAGRGVETVDVVGPVCESGDFFAQDRSLPHAERGDLLAVLCAGAYGYALSSNYNARLRVAEVLIDGDDHRLIRDREVLEDL